MSSGSLGGSIGLGLRRDLADGLLSDPAVRPDFLEIAPENWLGIGGRWGEVLHRAAAEYPLTAHGLSLSLGSPEELDWAFVDRLAEFFEEIPVALYSEHLSYSKVGNAHLYDLLPIPFRRDAVAHVAARIRAVQQRLGRRLAIENVSYYVPVAPEMTEAEFIAAVVEESDCDLLLDINNAYVNAFNHGYDAKDLLSSLPLERVVAIHMAGHERVAEDLIIDTHGQPVIDPVFDLLAWTLERIKPVPILLERDFNIPALDELGAELTRLRTLAAKAWSSAMAGVEPALGARSDA